MWSNAELENYSNLNGLISPIRQREYLKSKIKDNKFVEEGQYKKNLYGTSIESIRSVMTRSKVAICVMNAPSISVMRRENLKPFVIFIKPPGKEQIQTNVLREDLTLTEEEIEQMISSGRIIEHDYGHLFDEIIINQSLDQTYQVIF